MDQFNWITFITTLGAVSFGAYITPYLASKIEDRKIKKSIKPRLVKCVYEFYNYRKRHITQHNYNSLSYGGLRLTSMQMNTPQLPVEALKELTQQFESYREDHLRFQRNLDDVFFKLVSLESDLHSLLVEINSYYSTSTYNKLSKIIQQKIDDSNNLQTVDNFYQDDPAELNRIRGELADKLVQIDTTLDSDCSKLIKTIIQEL